MAAQRPLVRTGGRTRQLAAGDYITGTAARFVGSPAALTGLSSIVFGPFPASARRIHIHLWDSAGSAVGASSVRAHVAGVAQTSGYVGRVANHQASQIATLLGGTDEFWLNPNNVNAVGSGSITFTKTEDVAGAATWVIESNLSGATGTNLFDARGYCAVTGQLSHVELRRVTAAQTFTAGFAACSWE